VSRGSVVVIVNSPKMIGICQELINSGRNAKASKHVAAQVIIGNNCHRQDRRFGNPLVPGSSPAHPTSEAIFPIRSHRVELIQGFDGAVQPLGTNCYPASDGPYSRTAAR
jgi:hypothetical protein